MYFFVLLTLYLGMSLETYLSQESKILKFLGFMWNPLSWVMEAAAIMAIAMAHGGVSSSLSTSLVYYVYLLTADVMCQKLPSLILRKNFDLAGKGFRLS